MKNARIATLIMIALVGCGERENDTREISEKAINPCVGARYAFVNTAMSQPENSQKQCASTGEPVYTW